MNNQRDTQFAGFAQRLYDELAHNTLASSHLSWKHFEQFKQEQYRIIARRAYDLVEHAVLSIGPAELDMLTTEECVQRVPDLTDLQE